jgi:hypothetical protein
MEMEPSRFAGDRRIAARGRHITLTIGSMDRQTLRDWVHRFNASLWKCGRLSFFSFADLLPTFEGGRLRTWNQYGGAEL